MNKSALSILLLLFLHSTVLAQVAPPGDPGISQPLPGEVLQGEVSIVGNTDIPGFSSAEVAFSYADDTTSTWFLIATISEPSSGQILTTWDTSSITDGTYSLRLRVILMDSTHLDILARELRVRNYTPIETPTPAPTAPEATALPTITPTGTPYPTPTQLLQNRAIISTVDVGTSIIYGGMATLLLFISAGLYILIRRNQS
jgi:hypothetical protein